MVTKEDFHRLLSHQEGRILSLLANGLTQKEIVLALHISNKTFRNYLTSINTALGTKNRTHAVATAVHMGIISPFIALDNPSADDVAAIVAADVSKRTVKDLLTGSQMKVYEHLEENPGSTNKEIADALYISPNTVRTHLRKIMNVLGISGTGPARRAALIARIIEDKTRRGA